MDIWSHSMQCKVDHALELCSKANDSPDKRFFEQYFFTWLFQEKNLGRPSSSLKQNCRNSTLPEIDKANNNFLQLANIL